MRDFDRGGLVLLVLSLVYPSSSNGQTSTTETKLRCEPHGTSLYVESMN